jgi:5-amino-6-(5-phosphoribosylamino)uracil reductase
MEAARYRRLLPRGPDTGALDYVASLDLRPRHGDRPHLIANFVASVDGHSTVGEQSRRLSGPADRELFYALRERVDAVLIGTTTLAAEHYKRMLPQPERRDRRTTAGRPQEPLAVTISRSGRVPREIPLFHDTPDNVLVFEGDGVPLDAVLHTLRREHRVETLLCEGGPTLLGALLREGMVDELLLTLAPSLTGGASGPAVVSGPPPGIPAQLELAAALEHDGAMFLRYRLS